MKKIIVEWNEYMMTEDVATSLSLHALDRAAERGGEPIMQLRQEVENLVQQAENSLIDFSNQYKTFLLKGKKGLAVVGSLIKKGADYIFKVITLHRKKNFVPNNPNDKVIDLSEDTIKGGLADNTLLSSFDREQLLKGIRIELEHTNNVKIAAEIASDHLTEDSEYYNKLEKMENTSPQELQPTKEDTMPELVSDSSGVVTNKEELKEKQVLRRQLESSIASLEDLSANMTFAMNSYNEKVEKALQILFELHNDLATDTKHFPNDVLPYAQKFAMTESNTNNDLEYAKRFMFKHFLGKDTNIIISRVSNLGEDLEDMMQDGIESGQRTIFVKPEVEFITRDLTDNSEKSVYIDLIEEYSVYHNQQSIHSSPEDSLDPKLKSKRWDKIYVEGNEVTPDEDLKSILDKTFNYQKN